MLDRCNRNLTSASSKDRTIISHQERSAQTDLSDTSVYGIFNKSFMEYRTMQISLLSFCDILY